MEHEIDEELEFDLEELMDLEDQFNILMNIKKEEESMTLPPRTKE